MDAYIDFYGKTVKVTVTAKFLNPYDGMIYRAITPKRYDCEDYVSRNFTGEGKTLEGCLHDVYLKLCVHKPTVDF